MREIDRQLIDAAIRDDVKTIKKLVEKGADINATDEYGRTALMHSYLAGNNKATTWLISRGAYSGISSHDGSTVIHAAAQSGDTKVITRALETSGLNVDVRRHKDSWTPLMVACKAGKKDAAKLLVIKGANPKSMGKTGYTILHAAAESGDTDTMKFALQASLLNIDVRSDDGWTPLMVACKAVKKDAVTWLVTEGADPGAKSKTGYTILHAAAESGDIDTMKVARQASRLNVDVRSDDGWTPLMVACKAVKKDAARWLVTEGASLQSLVTGYTILHAVAESGDINAMEVVLQDLWLLHVDERSDDDWTPLMVACKAGKKDAARWLVFKGANPGAKSKTGYTILHAAAESGDIDTIEFALKASCLSIDVKDNAGRTALDIAKELGHTHLHHFLGGEGENRIEHTNNITKIQTEINPLLQSISGDPEAKVEHDLDNKSSTGMKHIKQVILTSPSTAFQLPPPPKRPSPQERLYIEGRKIAATATNCSN